MSGSLFKADKDKPEDRDYSGQCRIDGKLYWISGYINESKRSKYLGLKFKSQAETQPARSIRDELDDEIPL